MKDFIYFKDIKRLAGLYLSIVFILGYVLSGVIYYFGTTKHYLPVSAGLLGVFILKAVRDWFSNES